MEYAYDARGICAVRINFSVEDNRVKNVMFIGGCEGNHKGLSRLVEGMEVDEVINRLEGLTCGMRQSSCPDQLAQALKVYKKTSKVKK